MNPQRSVEIKVGIVSIIAVILIIVGMMLGKGYSVSVSQQTIKFRFPNSGGIVNSNPIVVNGVKRGIVTSVKNDNGSVLVEASIDNTDDLTASAKAVITILEITGGKKIEIIPGNSSQKFDPNREIPGDNSPDLVYLVTEGGKMVDDLHQLLAKLDTISSGMNKIFGDGKSIAHIKNIIDNTDYIVNSIKDILSENSKNIDVTLKNFKVLSGDLRNIVQKNEPKLDSLLSQLDNTLLKTRKLMTNADSSLANVDFLIQDLRKTVYQVNSGDGFVNKLLYDKKFSMKLDSTLLNLYDFLEMVRQHGVNVNLRLGTRP